MSFSATVNVSSGGVSLTLTLELSRGALNTCPGSEGGWCEETPYVCRTRLALEEMSRELARLIDTLPVKIQRRVVDDLSDHVSGQEQALADLSGE